jgi:hypothetical protein
MREPLVRADFLHVRFEIPGQRHSEKIRSPKIRCYSRFTQWLVKTFTKIEVWKYIAHPEGKKEKVYYIKASDAKNFLHDSSIHTVNDFIRKIKAKVERATHSGKKIHGHSSHTHKKHPTPVAPAPVTKPVTVSPFKRLERALKGTPEQSVAAMIKDKSVTETQIKDFLNHLKSSDDPKKAEFATRTLAAFEEMSSLGSDPFSKRAHQTLKSESILRICLVAEHHIATGRGKQLYLKKTDTGVKRSLLIDLTSKSWTVVVGDVLGTGTSKKVKTGTEIALVQVGQELKATTRSIALAVNREKRSLDLGEIKIAKLFNDDPRGVASVREITHYKKVKDSVSINKQIFAQERALGDLFDFSYKPPRINNAQLRSIASDTCYGLERMKNKGLVHRDIKLANILLFPDGAKLADFGLAGKVGKSQGSYGTYVAPEFHTNGGHHNHEADVYALGIALYQLKFQLDPPGVTSWDNLSRKDPVTEEYLFQPDIIAQRAVKQQQTAADFASLQKEYQEQSGQLSEDQLIDMLIFQMLHPDPTKRPTAAQALAFLEEINTKFPRPLEYPAVAS